MSAPAPITANVPPSKPVGKRGMMLRLLMAVIVIGAIGLLIWYVLIGRWYESTDDAYVGGNVVQITPMVPGTVVSIGADDGDLVREGQSLAQLDSADTATALAQSEAALARTVRQVRGLYNGIDSSQALLAVRKVELERARSDYARRQSLAGTGAISAEELAHARDQLAAAEEAMHVSSQKLAVDKTMVSNADVASQPDVRAAAAQLRLAYINNARVQIVAPVAGYVARRSVQLGQRVQPGVPLMAVVPLDQVWVDANFKETQLTKMRLGQAVTMHADIYGSSVDYRGTIESLGVGTGSAFALLPAQNATGNWIKIVQRLPVRIALDPDEVRKNPLRIGLSMSVDVNLHRQGGEMLPSKPGEKPILTTDVYAHQMQDADALVNKIIQDNLGTASHAVSARASRAAVLHAVATR